MGPKFWVVSANIFGTWDQYIGYKDRFVLFGDHCPPPPEFATWAVCADVLRTGVLRFPPHYNCISHEKQTKITKLLDSNKRNLQVSKYKNKIQKDSLKVLQFAIGVHYLTGGGNI